MNLLYIKPTRVLLFALASISLCGCVPTNIDGETPDGSTLRLNFYPGGNILDDLIIYDEKNYFGKAQYQIDDPLADIGFRFKDGSRVQAECALVGKDFMGEDECKRYEVYRSSWSIIPNGTVFDMPEIF